MTDNLKELGTEEDRPCRDPECTGIAEAEIDGDHKYFACGECGYEFGHTKIAGNIMSDENCGIGVPESLRRRASEGMAGAMEQDRKAQPVPVTIGFGRPQE
jgi:hypothetical protein